VTPFCVIPEIEWMVPFIDVDLGEDLCLVSVLKGVNDLQLYNMDFNSKWIAYIVIK
jgi:hypothetical protein